MEADASVEALVLEYLNAKGFTSAESALREQLSNSDPPPPTEDNFSALESILIRGKAAAATASAAANGSVLAPLTLPNGELPEGDTVLLTVTMVDWNPVRDNNGMMNPVRDKKTQ